MMASNQDLPLRQREEIDRLADQFEREFRAGRNPRIEDYLRRQPGLCPLLVQELLALEIELRQAAGDRRSPSDYENRSSVVDVMAPELATTIEGQPNTDDDRQEHQPERLGRYAIRRVLGRGGFGVVYLAHDPQLDRLVALKVPRRTRFQTAQQAARFIVEARTAANLKHPSLVMVHDVQEHDGLPYIVQEYIEGQNLDDWSAAKQPSFQQIARILVGVAEAVGCAHQHGLVHRDLKPANILMGSDGKPHIADFGLAMREDARWEHAGELAGSFHYMSPEQIRREAHRLDGRSDIWSMGVILYELLAGVRPFSARNHEQLIFQIQHDEPKPLRQIAPELPVKLTRICMRCLAKRATDRYQATIDFVEDLNDWLNDHPGDTTSVSKGLADNMPIEALGETNPLLKPMWHQIDDDLRKIFVVAATLAEVESKNYVSTTNFVRALMFLRPGKISDFFNRLPDGALPESVPDGVPMHLSALRSLDSFSPCINSAMANLTPRVSNDDKLSSEDVYIDIARYATGKSTQRLRSHGVSKQDVERIVKQLGWQLVERHVATAE
jgi:serine/threonine protein kinase